MRLGGLGIRTRTKKGIGNQQDRKSQDEYDAEPKDQEKEKEVKPEFGPRPDTDSPDFDFDKEVDRLPFPLNMGTAPLTLEQKKCFINLIYTVRKSFLFMMGIWVTVIN